MWSCMNEGILWKRKVVISDPHMCGPVCVRAVHLIELLNIHIIMTDLCSIVFTWDIGGFLKSCRARNMKYAFLSATLVCAFKGIVDHWTVALILRKDNHPHLHRHLQPGLSIGCIEVWVMQARWSRSAGIQTRPLAHYRVCVCMCGGGEGCDAIKPEVLPAVLLRNLFSSSLSLSLSHISIRTAPCFHFIKSESCISKNWYPVGTISMLISWPHHLFYTLF